MMMMMLLLMLMMLMMNVVVDDDDVDDDDVDDADDDDGGGGGGGIAKHTYTAYYGYTLRTCNKSNAYKQTVYVYYVRLGTHCHTCKSIIGGWSPNINA